MIDEAGILRKEIKIKVETFLKELGHDIDILYNYTIRDEKTGLYKLRFFNSIFEIERDKHQRAMKSGKKRELTIMVIDIDNFRTINTDFGHLVGDQVIVALANVMKETLRKSDIIARFGGEEFVILLPETSAKKAKKVSSRLRNATYKDKTLKKYKITFSAGVATMKINEKNGSIFKRADKALYKAKKEGKNRTEIAE